MCKTVPALPSLDPSRIFLVICSIIYYKSVFFLYVSENSTPFEIERNGGNFWWEWKGRGVCKMSRNSGNLMKTIKNERSFRSLCIFFVTWMACLTDCHRYSFSNCKGKKTSYSQGNLFEILLNETEIRLYLPCTDWFGTANGHRSFDVPNQLKNDKCNLISVSFNKISKRFLCV